MINKFFNSLPAQLVFWLFVFCFFLVELVTGNSSGQKLPAGFLVAVAIVGAGMAVVLHKRKG